MLRAYVRNALNALEIMTEVPRTSEYLAYRLGVSHDFLRRALVALHKKGIVRHASHLGYSVRDEDLRRFKVYELMACLGYQVTETQRIRAADAVHNAIYDALCVTLYEVTR